MKEDYVWCPVCDAGLIAWTNVDRYVTHCSCCGTKFTVQRDENGLCNAKVEHRFELPGWLMQFAP